jgi:hypothetical protein
MVALPGTLAVKGIQYLGADEQRKEDIKEETKAAVAGSMQLIWVCSFYEPACLCEGEGGETIRC